MQISKYIPQPIILIFAVLVLGVAALLLLDCQFRPQAQPLQPSLIGGPFTLQNLDGTGFTERDLQGHYSLIFFGYASERDVTPTELRVMAAALDQLGPDAERFKAYFVTLDPERDRTETLKSYLSDISPELIGLTGTSEQIAAMAKAYHVLFRKVPDPHAPQSFEIEYSPLIYVMDPDGKFIKPYGYTTDAKNLAEGLKSVLE